MHTKRVIGLVSWAALTLAAGTAAAAELYIDPATGSDTGDGSAAKPWKTLEQVAKGGAFGTTIKAGDTVWLKTGHHGSPVIKNGDFTPPIVIAAAAGQKPTAGRVTWNGAKGFTLRGVTISPSLEAAPTPGGTIVLMDPSTARITLEDCEIWSVADATGWTADQWINTASSGVFARGASITVRKNQIRNVRFGISVDGPGALIDGNSVVGFSADGMRGLGDDGVYQYNVIKDVYVSADDGDDNHDDGFQSWSVGADGPGSGVVKNVVLRGNVFINREDPNQPLQNSMQGIGCFDGMFEGWVVENNVVITDHWHGISFYGLKSSRIVNNTVIDVNDAKPGPPWIKVTAHKNGTASDDVVVRNNLATDFQLDGTDITEDHNTTLTDLAMFFVDPGKFDLHLLQTAPAVDSGSADMAPPLDIEGITRPQGAGVDQGAYEWHDPSVMPADGGVGGGGTGGTGQGTGGTGQGGAAGNGGGGVNPTNESSSGCGCAVPKGAPAHPAWVVLGAALLWARRRRGR